MTAFAVAASGITSERSVGIESNGRDQDHEFSRHRSEAVA